MDNRITINTMKSSGYPTTLCGMGDFRGSGCNTCCKGQVVETTPENWKKISNTLEPRAFEIAARRSVHRLEVTIPESIPEIINSHPVLLRPHVLSFLKFPDRFASITPFNKYLLDTIHENQETHNNGTPFNSSEALSYTRYFQDNKSAFQEPVSETTVRLGYLLMNTISNTMSDRGNPLSMNEIMEAIDFMFEDGSNVKDYPCPLLNTSNGKCEVYEHRPEVCKITGNYCPDYLAISGCGANRMYSTLNGERNPLYPTPEEIFSERLLSNFSLPLEFFLVREFAAKNKEFAQNPTSFFPKPNKRKRH